MIEKEIWKTILNVFFLSLFLVLPRTKLLIPASYVTENSTGLSTFVDMKRHVQRKEIKE